MPIGYLLVGYIHTYIHICVSPLPPTEEFTYVGSTYALSLWEVFTCWD